MAEITIERIALTLHFGTNHFSFERPTAMPGSADRLQTRWAESDALDLPSDPVLPRPTNTFTPAAACLALIAAVA
jgi:hypothetical protein